MPRSAGEVTVTLDGTAAHCLRCGGASTDVDVMEQAIGSLLTSKGCKDLIDHII